MLETAQTEASANGTSVLRIVAVVGADGKEEASAPLNSTPADQSVDRGVRESEEGGQNSSFGAYSSIENPKFKQELAEFMGFD
jgi:hypothetical protein